VALVTIPDPIAARLATIDRHAMAAFLVAAPVGDAPTIARASAAASDLVYREAVEGLLRENAELQEVIGEPCADTDGNRFLRFDCLAATPYGGSNNPTLEDYQHTSACKLAAALLAKGQK
jgi:hypothetical protein